MKTLVYCIEHEEMVELEDVNLDGVEFCGHICQFVVLSDGGEVVGTELDFCEFPLGYTFCPPPESLPEGWQDELTEEGEEILVEEKEPYFDLSLEEEYIAWVMYRKSKGLAV